MENILKDFKQNSSLLLSREDLGDRETLGCSYKSVVFFLLNNHPLLFELLFDHEEWQL